VVYYLPNSLGIFRCMYATSNGTKDSSEAELLAINKVLQLSAAEDSMFWASKFLSNQIQQLQNFVAYMHLNMEVISDA
jgi:hypothetical protein